MFPGKRQQPRQRLHQQRGLAKELMLRLAHHLLVGAAIQLGLERLRGKFCRPRSGLCGISPGPCHRTPKSPCANSEKLTNGLALEGGSMTSTRNIRDLSTYHGDLRW